MTPQRPRYTREELLYLLAVALFALVVGFLMALVR
jgi:hypothetical protein